MIQTFVCDTCKKAIDITQDNNIVLNPVRCVITRGCRGLLSSTNSITVNPDQYAQMKVDSTAWVQVPVLYQHNQTVARSTWIVNHNLNAQPMVQVYVAGSNVPADINSYTVKYVSSTTVNILFDNPTAGIAECQVRGNTLPVVPKTTTASTANFLISPNSVLTLAIAAQSVTFNLATYTDSSTPIASTTVTVGKTSPRFASPWRNSSTVLINGRRYYICDVALQNVPATTSTFSASFSILNTDGTPFALGAAYVLLSNDPYEAQSDRVLNSCLDVASLSNTQDTVYDSVNLYCLEDLVQPVYPPIISL